jgi:hypothetical protein
MSVSITSDGEALVHVTNFPEPISLRDWFAGMAMQGMLANPNNQLVRAHTNMIAEWAALQADAMIARKEMK